MSNFSKTLKQLRMKNDMTQAQLAERLGISGSSVSMYERGEREPDFETQELIADFFNVDMNYLMGYNTEMPPLQISRDISEDGIRIAEKASLLSEEDRQKVLEYISLLQLKDRQ